MQPKRTKKRARSQHRTFGKWTETSKNNGSLQNDEHLALLTIRAYLRICVFICSQPAYTTLNLFIDRQVRSVPHAARRTVALIICRLPPCGGFFSYGVSILPSYGVSILVLVLVVLVFDLIICYRMSKDGTSLIQQPGCCACAHVR